MLLILGLFLITYVSGLYDSSSPVILLSEADFKSKVVNSKDIWFIEFFASWCGHCKALAPEYEKAALALQGIVKVGAVEDSNVMKNYNVEGFPTLKFFGVDKKSPSDYKGDRTATGIVDYSIKEVGRIARSRLGGGNSSSSSGGGGGGGGSSSDVIILTDKNFDELVMNDIKNIWLLEFYAPWCGHCKQLAPTWEKVATKLKGKVKVAKIDATVETAIAGKYSIKGFPTIKLYNSGKKTVNNIEDYTGGRSTEEIVEFALQYASENKSAEQLLSNDMFEENCMSGVCGIAFLPHLYDCQSECRNKYLKELNEAYKSSRTPVRIYWSQAGDQFDFEEQLRLGFGFPALVAVNVEKGIAVIQKGSFTQDSIKQFLNSLAAGTGTPQDLPKELTKLKIVNKWDGKDMPVETYDDEL
eukprot:GHVL01032815.1.p1 GENE.GHVL01032815.1~~GHVL01032815.1.p1  ORF type:complete len:413 (+),score=87.11 GHVL01032815.1:1377-2615(+)